MQKTAEFHYYCLPISDSAQKAPQLGGYLAVKEDSSLDTLLTYAPLAGGSLRPHIMAAPSP